MSENEIIQRIRNAIILLKDGRGFKVGDLTLEAKDNYFSVSGWTSYNYLKNLTRQKALAELAETKELFKKMLAISPELVDFIKNRELVYFLYYEDCGCGLEICSEINGQVKWTKMLKE